MRVGDDQAMGAFFQDVEPSANLWQGRYKIPWDEPDFSRRMLKEHLTQEHDLASRRSETIATQVNWIHEKICGGQSKRILDLGCGPGLYLKAFAQLGHRCMGIDFSPASIAYAREQLPKDVDLDHADLREALFGDGYDVVIMLYGELNVFSPAECASLLAKIHGALAPGGCLVLEPHTFAAVRGIGQGPKSWDNFETGLFSEEAHLCLTENRWLEEVATSLQRFFVIDAASGTVDQYRSTTKAWTNEEYEQLLAAAGFVDVLQRDEWPSGSEHLMLWTAKA